MLEYFRTQKLHISVLAKLNPGRKEHETKENGNRERRERYKGAIIMIERKRQVEFKGKERKIEN